MAESYALAERFERALPLLASVINWPGKTPDPMFLYYRGLAEFKTGKTADAEKFNAAVKANPRRPRDNYITIKYPCALDLNLCGVRFAGLLLRVG